MSEYVKGFKNRKSQYFGTKEIDILSEEVINGTQTITSTFRRYDGSLQEEGTKVNALNMNKAILDLVYYELYGIEFINYPYFMELVGDSFEHTYNIKFHQNRLYPKVKFTDSNNDNIDDDNLTVSFLYSDDNDDTLDIIVRPGNEITKGGYEYNFEYRIDLYYDEECSKFAVSINRYFHYVPSYS